MGIPDNSLVDLIQKVRSWISWGTSDQANELYMANNSGRNCCDCLMNLEQSCIRYHCETCDLMLCENCVHENASLGRNSTFKGEFFVKYCKVCSDIVVRNTVGRRYGEKIHPLDSPRRSPEPPSPSSSGERYGERLDGYSLHPAARCSVTSFASNPSSVLDWHSPSRSDEDEGEYLSNHFFSSCLSDLSDVDSHSVSDRHEFYSFKSAELSPLDSPSGNHFTSDGVGQSVQHEQMGTSRSEIDGPIHKETLAVPERPDAGVNDFEKLPKPFDFENNGFIWFPPPPDDESAEREDSFLYDDKDYEVGESSAIFSYSGSLNSMLSEKHKQNDDHKEPLRAVVHGHFRALVSQLLHGESIKTGSEDVWLDVVSEISWQAANFVKPDTSRGGSMDPGNYVKVKCIASGKPSESKFIKGIVCTKNIKHKRMNKQYINTKIMILGGALEYLRAPNQLASFDTLLQQETDHLKMIVSKIEAHRPNVLLVEKSVSSYAQEYLLAKEISLVLNVKKPLLERIARCTGAPITPSVDKFSTTRLGHCELFRLEKVSEEHEASNQFNKKPSKTLMFFEGCPRRLGCTILLKGSCREELKKVKHVVQYAVFAAYHLSLETSFLADEGASIPKLMPLSSELGRTTANSTIPVISTSVHPTSYVEDFDLPSFSEETAGINLDLGGLDLSVESLTLCVSSPSSVECKAANLGSDSLTYDLASLSTPEAYNIASAETEDCDKQKSLDMINHIQMQQGCDVKKLEVCQLDVSSECYSATDSHQSILVSFSSRRVLDGAVCERSRLMRIKFYGCFDKPLGRYLQDDLFDQTSCCRSCKEPAEAHVLCYTHQQGNLTINVRRLPSVKLPGERDGKIWMWHRCLMCDHVNGVPPATRRVVMSDAAWGLSLGKFLELSFSNHATANRVARCGHSLQKDCLRYYGLGSMVAFFRYSRIDILSVCLPPSKLEFIPHAQQGWLKKEAIELLNKSEALHEEISGVLQSIGQKSVTCLDESPVENELYSYIMELKEQLIIERNNFNNLLQPATKETVELDQVALNIFELNRLRHELIVGLHNWDCWLCTLDALLSSNAAQITDSYSELNACRSVSSHKDGHNCGHEDNVSGSSNFQEFPQKYLMHEYKGVTEVFTIGSGKDDNEVEVHLNREFSVNRTSLGRVLSAASELSDRIDSAWTGTKHLPLNNQLLQLTKADGCEAASLMQLNKIDNKPCGRLLSSPVRVYSFDSATSIRERIRKGLPSSSSHLSKLASFHASGDYRNMIRDPISNGQRTSSQISPCEAPMFNHQRTMSFSISSASFISGGARLLLPQNGQSDLVIAVYDSEPTSIISYALSSKEYKDWIAGKPNNGLGGAWQGTHLNIETRASSALSAWQSFGSSDYDYMHSGSYSAEDGSTTTGTLFTDANSGHHLKVSFEDQSSNFGGKMKFSVICYFSKQFHALRKKYSCGNMDFIHSLSRCRRWNAQGGKSNAYFAKTLDERYIIKQMTKTELESFDEFAPEYFKYLTDSQDSGSPSCLAKVLGIYQVTVKHSKGGKESKMDIMVMENIFFKRNVSRVYDLKGSARSRYNSDTEGSDKVLLDMNLLEAVQTKPMFLGSKAKRSLERAVWNDTSFLASVDVMDYSLLVGVDDEHKELVVGIIDFMRQYTWDKHLETWVKASGILGGPKNASPTIISPKQYKKRFRKAMTSYFLTVPDQWSP